MSRYEHLRGLARLWRSNAATDGSHPWRERADTYGICAEQLTYILDDPTDAPARPKVIAGWLGDCECTEVVGSDGSMWRQSGSSWERMRGPFDGGTS